MVLIVIMKSSIPDSIARISQNIPVRHRHNFQVLPPNPCFGSTNYTRIGIAITTLCLMRKTSYRLVGGKIQSAHLRLSVQAAEVAMTMAVQDR